MSVYQTVRGSLFLFLRNHTKKIRTTRQHKRRESRNKPIRRKRWIRSVPVYSSNAAASQSFLPNDGGSFKGRTPRVLHLRSISSIKSTQNLIEFPQGFLLRQLVCQLNMYFSSDVAVSFSVAAAAAAFVYSCGHVSRSGIKKVYSK